MADISLNLIALLQQMRLLLIYPLLLVSGIAWCIGFGLRWHWSRCAGDRWAMRVGLAHAIVGGLGVLALWIAGARGFSALTTAIFTIGLVGLAFTSAAGALYLFAAAWHSAKAQEDEHGLD